MSFSIGLSGLHAASNRMDNAALDIARATLPSPRELPIATDNAGDSALSQSAATTPTDLPGAMVEQIAASLAFMANVETIRRTDENLQALLDRR